MASESLLAALLLAAALPARSAPRARPPEGVPPLFIRDLADPMNPLVPALERQSAALLERLPAAADRALAARAFLEEGRGPGSPDLESTAAGVLVRVLTRPSAAQELAAAQPGMPVPLRESVAALSGALPGHPSLEGLARAAESDALVEEVFEGGRADPRLAGLRLEGGGFGEPGARSLFLGRGQYGRVFTHPRVRGAAVKIGWNSTSADEPSPLVLWDEIARREDARAITDLEEEVARALADAGAGPRHLARGEVSGFQARVMERVYGQTLTSIIRNGRFGPGHYRLVEELLDLLAGARLHPGDARLANIMIGRTLLDDRPRALVVDGGWLERIPEDQSPRRVRARLRDIVVREVSGDPLVGSGRSQALLDILAKALDPGHARIPRRRD